LIREGMAADVLVFDEILVSDKSTFSQPHAYSAGFRYVIVNGEIAIDDGNVTHSRSGTVLYGPGFAR
jgi:N-acyl-D-amino-acid deacylase